MVCTCTLRSFNVLIPCANGANTSADAKAGWASTTGVAKVRDGSKWTSDRRTVRGRVVDLLDLAGFLTAPRVDGVPVDRLPPRPWLE